MPVPMAVAMAVALAAPIAVATAVVVLVPVAVVVAMAMAVPTAWPWPAVAVQNAQSMANENLLPEKILASRHRYNHICDDVQTCDRLPTIRAMMYNCVIDCLRTRLQTQAPRPWVAPGLHGIVHLRLAGVCC